MLSNHSFNALLKTLEEPPPHVKFLLATTDPQKLPVTVLSRCLQFNLKRFTVAQIQAQLEKICAAEGIASERDGLKAIARAAEGSMRDALSLLDQGIAFGGGKVDGARDRSDARQHRPRPRAATARSVGAAGRRRAAGRGRAARRARARLRSGARRAARALAAHCGAAARRRALDDEELAALAPFAERNVRRRTCSSTIRSRCTAAAICRSCREPRMGFEMTLLRMLAFRPAAETGARWRAPFRACRVAGGGASGAARAERGAASAPQAAPAARPSGRRARDAERRCGRGAGLARASLQTLDLRGPARQLADQLRSCSRTRAARGSSCCPPTRSI